MIYATGTKADEMLILDDLPEGHHQSHVFLFTQGRKLAQLQKIGVLREAFLASEAWMSMGKPGEKKPIAPINDPEKTEALVVYSLDIIETVQGLIAYSR